MRVVILGGGTAGWMAAATLAKQFGHRLDITVILSEQIGTIGVGEATLPQIRTFLSSLGLSERSVLQSTSATIKLGIEFIDWQAEGTRYFHGFGDVGRSIGPVAFYHYWLRHAAQNGAPSGAEGLEASNINALAAKAGRFGPGASVRGARMPASAFHLDAGLLADLLTRQAMAAGVTRIDGAVRDWTLNAQSGFVESLTLADGRCVSGDLFLDCSGLRGVLIEQALASGYEDWSHWLPCDRAFAMATTGRGGLDPFTRASARDAGWQWEIPLQHRTGNGHVYASAFCDDDAALERLLKTAPGQPISDPRPLRFLTGKRRKIWNRNVVAIGLSSGFLEPLESTSIHLVQSALARLIALFPDRNCDPVLVSEFNAQMDAEYAAIRDFLILHYHVTDRDGSEFWRYCKAMSVPDSLRAKLDSFVRTARITRQNGELFDVPSWVQVMYGQGLRPAAWHPLVDAASDADLTQFIAMNEREAREAVQNLDDHANYIARAVDPTRVAGERRI